MQTLHSRIRAALVVSLIVSFWGCATIGPSVDAAVAIAGERILSYLPSSTAPPTTTEAPP